MSFILETRRDWQYSYRSLGSGSRKVLFFHGFPGSSLQVELFRPFVQAEDLHVVCVDRPGYLKTQSKGGDHFEETSQVMELVLEGLGWQEFELVSVSGGTPYAVTFAHRWASRVRRLTVICGMGPVGDKDFPARLPGASLWALRILPQLPKSWVHWFAQRVAQGSPGRRPRLFEALMPLSGPDRISLSMESLQGSLREGLLEAVEQKGLGPQKDARAFLVPWRLSGGTSGEGLPGEKFSFWHGQEDEVIPSTIAMAAHEKVVGSRLVLVPGEGHYSLPIRQMGRILRETRV